MFRLVALLGFIPLALAMAGKRRRSESYWRELVLKKARAELGSTDPTPYYATALGYQPEGDEEWCGVFALAMLKAAGLAPEWMWEVPEGFLYRLPRAKTVQPADMFYSEKRNHHGIVEQLNRDASGRIETVQTLDGNSVGGAVARNVRSPEEISAYYSIAPLIEEARSK